MVRVQSLRIRSPRWKDESIAPVFQHRPARFFLPNIITQPRHASSATGRDDSWQTVIGLEIHAQLKTGRKLFSKAPLSHSDAANTHIELVDAAFPGSLPSLDRNAIRLSLLTALALDCSINSRSTFDRKHYFYHDIPASYQITQHYNPLARSGRLRVTEGDSGSKRAFHVRIKQLQVEQDTAKSQVVGDERLVDLNRAGTGLMEIVTEPDMRHVVFHAPRSCRTSIDGNRSAEEAGAFVRKLQSLLRRLRSGDGDMENGNLRVDVNVSVHRPGSPFGTRCEVKNINSVRFLQQAIESERRRHVRHYERSPAVPLKQETRGLNEMTGETFSLRTKEEAEDYRYMPDANLPAMVIDPVYLDRLRGSIPEMPWDVVDRLVQQYGVTQRDLETLVGLDEYEGKGLRYYEDVTQGNEKIRKKALNWIAHELLGQLRSAEKAWSQDIVPAGMMREIVTTIDEGTITGTTGKAVIRHLIDSSDASQTPQSLSDVLSTLNLTPSSSDDLRAICEAAIVAVPNAAENVRKGKQKAVARIVGAVMKLSQGQADAQRAREIILEMLK